MKTFSLNTFMSEFFKDNQTVTVDDVLLQFMIRDLKTEARMAKLEVNKLKSQNEGMMHTIKILNQSKDYFLDLKA